ncbi:MAG: cysteine--tRNA ligase [Chromatiales bacterium]|jgi:cysteinyl-tRNA synthetase|nr:cysteine--tRNA ligase [Chromatiales bacterium]MDP6150344.1 cysteine--tRNA ligase [Gammaproteobacteria bacterium]MDP7271592.1 cysteine--tRNA ligase [Gammaproteobacteria bacterium]HJP03867.1 cysteine--tRNA ligase [Gammaproteobacteria bacterium]
MSLILYNTLTREKEEFVPGQPGRVSVYVCGPTVYNRPHIGNARPAVVFDVLVRLLRARFDVTYVRNITDIDDKINAAAEESGESIDVVAARHAADYHNDMAALGVLSPDVEPYATHHLAEMIEMIKGLIDSEHAYEAEGHVLFRVGSFSEYGRLSRRDRRQLLDGARVEVAPYKEDPGDFILWKPSSPAQPGWESPWGRGRPGWHIECSAMAAAHLGRTIDIHGGGNDLIFPHHENEIAQSTCAHGGEAFSRYWLHNGFVNVDHTKMSKSLGNIVLVRDLLDDAPGEVVRLALLNAHYRQPLDWSADLMLESRRKLDRLYNALRNVSGWEQSWQDAEPAADFVTALEDDLNTPRAIAALFLQAREINRLGDVPEALELARQLRASGEMLGLLSHDPAEWFVQGSSGEVEADEIDALLVRRAAARDAGDFSEADWIRDELTALGVVIEDGPDGTRWRRVGS